MYRLLPPRQKGGAWTEEVLHRFQGSLGGESPSGGVVFDGNGDLYGATSAGGSGCASGGCGIVFRLAGPRWTETVIYGFTNRSDGAEPSGGLVFDKMGNLYGTTFEGPGYGGEVFELSPPAMQGDPWTETTLYDFKDSKDGFGPLGGLILGKDGALYGTTSLGNNNNEYGNGSVFRIVP